MEADISSADSLPVTAQKIAALTKSTRPTI